MIGLGRALKPGVLVLTLAAGQVAGAQAQRRPARPSPAGRERSAGGSIDPVAVRAEYASALLQARRYREAAAEYRRLLQSHPGSFEWRLNYARALEWGGSHREAEVELKRLAARAPRNATVEQLLRSVRASIEPSSREARAWVTERPNYVPYRLALARAYVRERRPRSAFSHFDFVVGREPTAALLAEAGDARAGGGDRRGAVDLYRRAVARAPDDPTLGLSYARALTANRQFAAAIEQYTLLSSTESNPRLLAELAEVRRQSGDEAGAERDLLASIALRPTPEAYTALGDMYRWRGQFKRARATYDQALELRPDYRRAALRVAQLAREERPSFGYASSIDEQVGVVVGANTTTDNTGFTYAAAEGRVGYPLGGGTVIGVGVEPRLVYDASPNGGLLDGGELAGRILGTAVTAGLAQAFHGDDVGARIAGRAGVASHTAGNAMPILAGSAVVTYRGAWSLSVEGTQGPAYTNLMALAVTDDPSIVPFGSLTSALLTSRTFAVGVAAPFGTADVGAEFESMWLSDGNTRSAFQASVRLPLARGLSLLYSGAAVGFAERSTLYWDPEEYVAHALGLEYGVRTDDGVAFAARVLPGIGRAVQGLTSGDPGRFDAEPGAARFVGHFAGGADLSIRRQHWETALGAAFGTGRSGGYQRFDGTLRVRYTP